MTSILRAIAASTLAALLAPNLAAAADFGTGLPYVVGAQERAKVQAAYVQAFALDTVEINTINVVEFFGLADTDSLTCEVAVNHIDPSGLQPGQRVEAIAVAIGVVNVCNG